MIHSFRYEVVEGFIEEAVTVNLPPSTCSWSEKISSVSENKPHGAEITTWCTASFIFYCCIFSSLNRCFMAAFSSASSACSKFLNLSFDWVVSFRVTAVGFDGL